MNFKNAKKAREALTAKQAELQEVFTEAKTDAGEFDFSKVKCLGEEVKGSVAVAEKVRAMNAELDDIAKAAETFEAAEQAAEAQAEREKTLQRPPHASGGPGGGAKGGEQRQATKSLAEQVRGEKRYEEWVKQGAKGGIALQLEELLPSDMLAKGAQFDTLRSKTLFETGAGWAPESVRMPGFVEAAARPVQLIDIIPMAMTGQDQIVYMEETTRTHGAAEKAEGSAYAESAFELTEQNSPVRKITDSIPVTDEQLEDVAQAESYLNSRLTFGLRQKLDSQALLGDGNAPALRGIANFTNLQTQAKGADPVPDAFFKAMTKIRVTGRAIPTHHVMHPTDWEKIRLLRTADGVYIWGNPSEAGPERMWGLPVVQCDAGTAGTGWTGSFLPPWISLFERRGVDVQIGYVGSQFLEGKRTIRGDMRMALVGFRGAAFSEVTGL